MRIFYRDTFQHKKFLWVDQVQRPSTIDKFLFHIFPFISFSQNFLLGFDCKVFHFHFKVFLFYFCRAKDGNCHFFRFGISRMLSDHLESDQTWCIVFWRIYVSREIGNTRFSNSWKSKGIDGQDLDKFWRLLKFSHVPNNTNSNVW